MLLVLQFLLAVTPGKWLAAVTPQTRSGATTTALTFAADFVHVLP
jgi:hypothetical protein